MPVASMGIPGELKLHADIEITDWENRWKDARSVNRAPARYSWPAEPPYMPAIAKYHDDMRLKYERAARYPWLPVEPDPPD